MNFVKLLLAEIIKLLHKAESKLPADKDDTIIRKKELINFESVH